jgi:hypothetical protein
MKRNLFLILLSCIELTNCNAESAIDLYKGETLIVSQYKIIKHGYFIFLVFINDVEVKELVYSYSIDIENKKISCSKSSERIYNIQDKKNYPKSLRFETAEEFNRSQINTWREKYYACFANNFLDMTNDEKIDLLNELANKSNKK